ncbi:hypothetical protein [uncultured Oscillibacter sp.]|jgi:AcrR family transcriptional regulator|uniref:hypothetical protein n=1 Tax=uncultured Oscillibacter sp. TaxID=876091 RepID=UPI0025EDC2ED|nr:hypothetical protein [uncultured Oscillibacter sp.]
MPEVRDRTKSQLDLALRTLLREKAPDQIRVRELTELCGIRRQSFYYHFTDVYDLFAWSVEQERAALAARQENCLTWQQAFQDLLRCISANQDYCLSIRKALGRPGLQRMFGGAITRLLEQTSVYYRCRCGGEALSSGQGACLETMFLGLLDGWLCGDLRQSPEALTACMEESVQQRALGAMWQNFPRWRQPE